MTAAPRPLNPNLSYYLDFMRLAAAVTVFFQHAHNFLLQAVNVPSWGSDAVAVFFVLSGFVISYVAGSKEPDWRAYVTARAARILPVCILAILVTAMVDRIGISHDAKHYDLLQQAYHFYAPVSFPAALSHLTFTNQLWFMHVIFGTDEPYWSLGFEVQYYLFFGLLVFVRPLQTKIAIVGLWALIAGPKILMYLPLWLMGVLALKLISAGYAKGALVAIGCNLAALAVGGLALGYLVRYTGTMYLTSPDRITEAINLIFFNAIGLAVFLHILGAAAVLEMVPTVLARVGQTVRWLAGASFTIYLVHQPILVMLSAFADTSRSPALGWLLTLATLAICLVLAEFAERRKKLFAQVFAALLRPAREVAGAPGE